MFSQPCGSCGTAATFPGGKVELYEDKRRSLERQHETWSLQRHGFEAIHARGALQVRGVTEWMEFYEPGEGAAGALSNLRSLKEQAVQNSAPIGVGGEQRDRDTDDPVVMQERAKAGERALG